MIAELMKREIESFGHSVCSEHQLFEKARNGQVGPPVVAEYLSSLLFVIRKTPIHLALASEAASKLGATELSAYLRRKIAEEEGHDSWAVSDLDVLSSRYGKAFACEPSREVVELMDYVEHNLHQDPRRYLIYTLFAEYFTVVVGSTWTEVLIDRCGIPKSALTVVDKHVEADAEHAHEGFDAAARFIPSDMEEGALAVLRTYIKLFGRFIDHLGQLPS